MVKPESKAPIVRDYKEFPLLIKEENSLRDVSYKVRVVEYNDSGQLELDIRKFVTDKKRGKSRYTQEGVRLGPEHMKALKQYIEKALEEFFL